MTDTTQHYGTGRRKTATARVYVRPGSGDIQVNKSPIDDYFCSDVQKMVVRTPLVLTETADKVDIVVRVRGGGPTGQAGAIVMGLGRALKVANPDYDEVLRKKGFLTRDARIVERKKYGLRKARRAPQFTKR